jgi:hypothetical protein
MQLSMMIAEVGFMLKVSGSRIATPFAPPRPGSTPISTPSRMPMNMKPMLGSVRATPKPCIKLLISSMAYSPSQVSSGPLISGTRNQRSKTAKKTSGTPTDTAAVSAPPYLPWRRMK